MMKQIIKNKKILVLLMAILLSCTNHYDTKLLSEDAQKSLDIIKADMNKKNAKQLQKDYIMFYKFSELDDKDYIIDKFQKKPQDVTFQDLIDYNKKN